MKNLNAMQLQVVQLQVVQLGIVNFFSRITNPLYFKRRFFLEDLKANLAGRVMQICINENYDYKMIEFVRESDNYFEMLYCGQKTFWGYFIDVNEVD